jgi:plastocyanin
MKTTTRRNLLKAAAVGGVTATGLSAVLGTERGVAALSSEDQKGLRPGEIKEHKHDDRPLTDKRALAVVSFGQWDADPAAPFDRQPINTDTENRTRNIHKMLPFDVDIDAGGAVSFIISGVHQILVYGPGRKLDDVQKAWEDAGSPVIAVGPGLVDYAEDRVYRGLNPFVLNYLPLPGTPPADTTSNLVVDRVEAVNFKEPGRYLVVCGVRPHFAEGMHGYVRVRG